MTRYEEILYDFCEAQGEDCHNCGFEGTCPWECSLTQGSIFQLMKMLEKTLEPNDWLKGLRVDPSFDCDFELEEEIGKE